MRRILQNKFIHNQAGFSLIEIAIVLAIIGIIIAGVFKGQDLLENARLKSVYNQVNAFRIATHTFQDRFGALPGDFSHAKDMIDSSLKDGNQDGVLQNNECQGFWAHLRAAQLITFDNDAPTSRLGGRFTVVHNHANMPGVWYCLGNPTDNKAHALFTPLQALIILSQFDTVAPTQGRIRAQDGADTPGKCIKSGKLDLTNKMPACVLYFQL